MEQDGQIPDRTLSKTLLIGILALMLVAGALAGGGFVASITSSTPDQRQTILTKRLETAIAERDALKTDYNAALAERNVMRDEVLIRQGHIDRNQLELANKLLLQQITDERAHRAREAQLHGQETEKRKVEIEKKDAKIKQLNEGLKASLAALKAETAKIAKHQQDRDRLIGLIDGRP